MSSSYIVEPQEGSSKKDDTLILMVNDNGVISVDQETLQNLIVNQSNANVSVVRLGQTENDVAEGNITLTVDPPPPYAVAEANAANTSDPAGLVDPFMEMDPEQLERLETALQSEEAKQIFGENVTAMLDMLTVEEQQNSIRYSIELDHCYTSRFSPSQPKPADPLPDISSSDMDESICIDLNKSIIHTPVQSQISSLNISGSSTNAKQKVTAVPPKIVKQPSSTLTGSRPRRASTATQPLTNTPKSTVSPNSRSNSTQQESKIKDEEEGPEDELFSSSESSESEDSGSDSDFGPRSARRGVRARGGRRGLTTRGGSMAASRRRGSNKHMDSDQVRRLDLEMAAAVSAMKSPEKEEKGDKHGSVKVKKPLIKTLPSKRKDDAPVTASPVNEAPPVEQNVLQTTNQVKANLISANMIKGDMILTKPGQDRNQKVVFVQKQVLMNPNDVKSLGIKKQIIIPKNKLVISQNSKVPMSKEVKTSSPTIVMKSIVPSVQTPAVHQNITPMEVQTELPQSLPNQQKPSANIRIKSIEIKKEKKKVEIVSETQHKSAVETPKPVEAKAPPVAKKVVKKEHRKSDTFVAETLGPALFSTPDIIRRVGSTQEAKISENLASTTSTVSSTTSSHTTVTNIANPNVSIMSSSNPSINEALPAINVANILDEPMETNVSVNDSVNMSTKLNDEASLMPVTLDDDKLADKAAIAELLEPALDTASNSTSKEMPATVEQSNNVKHVVPESSIEGDEQLLATLEMEAAKQLPNDEELLAEALLLQETLGVDLEHTGLDDPPPDISDSILSSSLMDSTPPPVAVPLVQASSERIETPVAPVTPAPAAPPPALVKTEPTIKKEPKEPIQYIRGGRVITLPPIEAPATRSKRLQAKSDNQPIKSEKKPPVLQQQQLQPPLQQPKIEPIIIKTERTSNSAHVSFKNQDMIYDMNDDDDEEEEVNSDSEDDPNRLWCICRQPHNNRFMICCDMCQEWFHGKCVHVTKAMGEQMEHQGIEWVCPNCSKKKNEEGKSKSASRRQRNSTDSVINEQNRNPSGSNTSITADVKPATPGRNPNTSAAVTYCVVCKKEARKSSIYCSDACILAHAEETSTKEKPSSTTPHKVQKVENKPKSKSDIKIIVYDKKTGKVLTGAEAPTAVNLKSWLKEHPNYDVVKPSNFNTIQLGGKTVATIHTQGIKTNKQLQGKSPGQSKMVFTKIAGSKQTILAPSTKKVVLSDSPPVRAVLSPQQRLKQVSIATPSKNPASQVKQTTPKATLSQQQLQQQLHHHTQQKPMATSTPKATLVKKPLEAKPSTSQQKTPQQQRQLQQPQQQQRQQPVQQQQQQAQTVTKTPPPRKAETEPIRLNVRKTLADLLTSRIKEASDLTLSEEEILELALQIELEMFKFFKSTDSKYKAKYRSLVFNIKDTKNLTLFRKIADRSLTPDAVVKLSPDEMASQELAEWREKENKHQLDMIKKNELEMIAQAKSIVVKTHKGEQIIENEGIDANAAVQEIVSALNSGDTISSTVQDNEKPSDESKVTNDHKKREKERDKERRRSRSRDRSSSKRDRSRSKSRHRHKDRDRSKSKKDGKHKDKDRSRDKDRDRDKKKDKDRKDKHKSSHSSRSHNKSSHKDKDKDKDKDKEKDKDKYKIGEDKKDSSRSAITLASDKSIEDRLWRHIEDETTTNTLDGNESDLSDREPSSTVTIKTPDINEELDRDLELKMNESAPRSTCMVSSTMWRGIVHMNDVAHFFATAQNVSGNLKEVVDLLPDRFDVVGRITPSIVWEYIHKMILTETKEILIIKLTATNDEEKIPYITLYSYLNSRNRLAVFGNMPPRIKDFYVMPFSVGAKLPSVLLPIEGPGFEENRQQHLLIGIIIAHKREKRLAELPLNVLGQPAKMIKKEPQLGSDRSFTPPPSSDLLTATTGKDDSSLAQQQDPKSFSVISKIVPELSAKIKIESSSSSDNMQLDDDDEPYSPGEPVNVAIDDEDNALSSSANLKTTPRVKNSSELQRKMEELTRQIEEEKQQIQNISSSFLTDASSTTLPGLGLDPPDSSDVVEPYSPTDVRSFTPPPHGISKLTQPILEKVSNITIPPNLQEILANVKRQESTKVDPYIPSKPGATFLTTVNSAMYQNTERYSPTYTKTARSSSEVQSSPRKENKSTLSSLSDYDIMKKAEEELAALAAASTTATPALSTSAPPSESPGSESLPPGTSFDAPHR